MTAAQVEELRQAYLTRFWPKAKAGYSDKPGACRGSGGANDKVNSKYKSPLTLDECTQECNAHAGTCKGFAYNPDANGGECLIYGPGFAGACSDTSAASPTACANLGTCSDGGLSIDNCGSCSIASGTTQATCEGVGGTWTAGTWTSAGATWTEPSDGWASDFHPTNLIVHSDGEGYGSLDYTCYDADTYDHHAQCEGFIDPILGYNCNETQVDVAQGCRSTSDYFCATATCGTSNCGGDCNGCADGCAYCSEVCGKFTGDCKMEFIEMTREEKKHTGACPEGCNFVAEV